jgi:hypothetical protein
MHLDSLWAQQVLCFSVVLAVAAVNLLGLDCVTTTQAIAFVLFLTPCLIFTFCGLHIIEPSKLVVSDGHIDWALLFSWAVWLYSGVSSLGSMAGEVDNPRRTCARASEQVCPLACNQLDPCAGSHHRFSRGAGVQPTRLLSAIPAAPTTHAHAHLTAPHAHDAHLAATHTPRHRDAHLAAAHAPSHRDAHLAATHTPPPSTPPMLPPSLPTTS